jgi:glutathione S-transferase
MANNYHIIGRRGAGSLIAEFLFVEIGIQYSIDFPELEEKKNEMHPLGKVPVLICPNGSIVYETLAIVNHITARFGRFVPEKNSILNDRYWQFLSLLATSIYPAYHRQHHTSFYTDERNYDQVRERAKAEQASVYDYLELELNPYLCGDVLTAADFYLYMLTRWDLNKTKLRENRPKLSSMIDKMRLRDSVSEVLGRQKR